MFKNPFVFIRSTMAQGLSGMQGLVWFLVIIGIMVVVGITIIDKLMNTSGLGSDAVAAANTTLQAIDDIPDWLGVIVIVVIAAVILGLVSYFRSAGE